MLLANAILFLCLGAMWKTNDGVNRTAKFLMMGMGLWNFAALLAAL